MMTPALSTFSTQRYDHRLKHQLSSISDFFTTDATTDPSVRPSTIISEASNLMVQEPLTEGHSPRRPLSNRSSSDPASSRWHEGQSGRVSTLTRIDSSDVLSSDTSVTSFHLSAGGCEHSLLMAKRRESMQILSESSLSTSQIEAHIPAPPAEGLSEGMTSENERDDTQGQIRLVSSLPNQTDTISNTTSAIRAHLRKRNTRAFSSPLFLHQYYHPEYDSDDMWSWSDPSTSNSSSVSATSEPENGGRDNLIEDMAAISTFSDLLASSRNATSLSHAIPGFSASPLGSIRRLNSGTALSIDLANIDEEELIVGEAASRHTSHAAGLDDDDPTPPIVSPLPTDSQAWWKFYPGDQRMSWVSSCLERIGRRQSTAPETHPDPREPVAARPSPGISDPGSKELSPASLPSRPLSPAHTARPSSGARKILSAVLPCIPVLSGGKECVEKTNNNTGSNTNSRAKLIPTFSFGPWWKKDRQRPRQEEEEKGAAITEQPRGAPLEVRIDQQINCVVDH